MKIIGDMVHCGIRSTYSYYITRQDYINYRFNFLGRIILLFKSIVSPLILPLGTIETLADSNQSAYFAIALTKITSRKISVTNSLNDNVRDVDHKLNDVTHEVNDGSPIAQIERLVFHSPMKSQRKREMILESIKKILDDNPSVTINDTLAWDWQGVTPLMGVAANGHSQSCMDIMNRFHADPFVPDTTKKHLLHLLVAKGHHDFKEEPIDGHREDQYPLFSLVLDHPDIMKHINSRDICGLTPLHYACARRDTVYIKALIEAGANPYILDENNNNCFSVLKLSEETRVNILSLALSRDILDKRGYALDQEKRSLNSNYRPLSNISRCFIFCSYKNKDTAVGVIDREESRECLDLSYLCTVTSRSSFNKDTAPIEELMEKSIHNGHDTLG